MVWTDGRRLRPCDEAPLPHAVGNLLGQEAQHLLDEVKEGRGSFMNEGVGHLPDRQRHLVLGHDRVHDNLDVLGDPVLGAFLNDPDDVQPLGVSAAQEDIDDDEPWLELDDFFDPLLGGLGLDDLDTLLGQGVDDLGAGEPGVLNDHHQPARTVMILLLLPQVLSRALFT